MTTTIRAAFAAFLFAGIVAGTVAPRMASAHVWGQDDFRADSVSHDSIVVRWNALHEHTDPSVLPDPR